MFLGATRSPAISRLLGRAGLEHLAALPYRLVWHTVVGLITFGANEPERQASCVVSRRSDRSFCSHTKRSLSTRLPPPATLHDHANQYTDGLPESHVAPDVYTRQELVDSGLRFQFSHNTGQRRPVVVELRLLHTPLAVLIIKEFQHLVERLLGIIHDIGECLTLSVF
jgi:hypothetical protein